MAVNARWHFPRGALNVRTPVAANSNNVTKQNHLSRPKNGAQGKYICICTKQWPDKKMIFSASRISHGDLGRTRTLSENELHISENRISPA